MRCSVRAADDQVVLEVADSGPGILPEQRATIFERGSPDGGEPRRRVGGMEFALAVSREIAEAHRGRLTLEEDPGGGALFRLVLPRSAPEGTEVEREPRRPTDSGAVRMAREVVRELQVPGERGAGDARSLVLLAEKNPEMNRFVCEILEEEYRIVQVFDGDTALEQAIALRPDVIVSAIVLSGMSGERLVRAVRARHELDAVPILVLTAKADRALRVRMLREGAQDYVMKPFVAEEAACPRRQPRDDQAYAGPPSGSARGPGA